MKYKVRISINERDNCLLRSGVPGMPDLLGNEGE